MVFVVCLFGTPYGKLVVFFVYLALRTESWCSIGEQNVALGCVLMSNLNELSGTFYCNVGSDLVVFEERYRIRTCRKSWLYTVFTIQNEGR